MLEGVTQYVGEIIAHRMSAVDPPTAVLIKPKKLLTRVIGCTVIENKKQPKSGP